MSCPAQRLSAGPCHCSMQLFCSSRWVMSQIQSRRTMAHKQVRRRPRRWPGVIALMLLVLPDKCLHLCSCLSTLAVLAMGAARPALHSTALKWVCSALQPLLSAGRDACQFRCTAGWIQSHAGQAPLQCVHG